MCVGLVGGGRVLLMKVCVIRFVLLVLLDVR